MSFASFSSRYGNHQTTYRAIVASLQEKIKIEGERIGSRKKREMESNRYGVQEEGDYHAERARKSLGVPDHKQITSPIKIP